MLNADLCSVSSLDPMRSAEVDFKLHKQVELVYMSVFARYNNWISLFVAEPGFQWLPAEEGQRSLPRGSPPSSHLRCHPHHPTTSGTLGHQLLQPPLTLPHARRRAHKEAQL